jgi:hypothetical protein
MRTKNTLRIFIASIGNKALTWPLVIEKRIIFIFFLKKYGANTQFEYNWLSTGSSSVLF